MHTARIFLLTASLLCCAVAGAQSPTGQDIHPRPRIGLVLSGGGARGAAHIGVLKMLDRLHVPIDAIAGTSMGAVVGGLYASGMSGREIEQAMASVDWQSAFRDRLRRTELGYRRKEEDRDFLVNLPLGLHGKKLVIPEGLVQGEKLTETLRLLTLPVAPITDFARLPTPFRAVATNLETGEAVVMADGDLTTAMRASMSAPGVFAPVEYRGQLLVDGGLAENLPIDVARAMGVDVLIVVDAGFPLQPRKDLVSLPSITNQVLAILLQRDSQRQLQTLSPSDIIVSPQLGDFSSYDFLDTLQIVNAGERAADAMADRLGSLALPDEDYARYLEARNNTRVGLPKLAFIHVDDDSKLYQRQIEDMYGKFIGSTVDPAALKAETDKLYGRGDLELLDYRLVEDGAGQNGLDFKAERNSWGPNYLRFGVLLQDDFHGYTIFNAAGRLDFTELNSLGAESRWDVQLGTDPLLGTELYLPLSSVTRYFVAPHAQVEAHDVPQVEDGRQVGLYRVNSIDSGIDFGRELSNWGELRFGVLETRGSSRVSFGDFSVPPSDFNVVQYFTRFGYDTLDSPNFPHSGQALTTQLTLEGNGGGEQGTNQFTIDWRGAHSWARNTIVAWFSSGNTIGGSETNVRTFFPLGGFLNLSGVRSETLAGPQYAIGRLIYLRKVGNGGEGILDVPAYVGISLEDGNVWSSRSQISFANTRKDASVFFGADTYIGPAYFAIGYDDSGSVVFTIFLGRSF
ncbi:MAG TPA: patatin-like phospholipase family protein [Steroidobacteraceae bacterium]|nr:patatin-like phospholipase family protein [Steroidobacteraceae bacterium]